jgi:hypothetical protein
VVPVLGDARLPTRFWNKVQPMGSCWIWVACRNAAGYGSVSDGNGGTMLAHRRAWQALIGDLPPVLDHICHVRACVNPAHLRPVTVKQNCENLLGAYRNSASGIRGVRQRRNGTWEARVRHLGVLHELGPYDTAEEADQAARALRLALFTHNDADREAS